MEARMKLGLAYGKEGLEVTLPDGANVEVLGMRPMPPLGDPAGAVKGALAEPIGSAPLAEMAGGRGSACVVISDVTRPVPNRVILPPILRTLEESGIPKDRITLLVATGIHRPNEGDELIGMVGEEIVRKYRIVNHHATVREEMSPLGETCGGVPILVNTTFLAADLRIVTGLIEPHLIAGYSGGRKAICPGISSLETVKWLHGPDILEAPQCVEGVLEGNPFHEAALEIARKARVDFIVNVAMDEARRISGVFTGDLEGAHRAGMAFVEQQVRAEVPEPVDIVVTTGAGWPLDLTYYQALKGVTAALPIVKPGGTILLAAQCAEGIGGPQFTKLMIETESPEAFMEAVRRPGFFVTDQWMVEELCKVLRKARVLRYSEGIPPHHRFGLLAEPVASVEAGVELARRMHGQDARIAVIPKGPYVLARVGSEQDG